MHLQYILFLNILFKRFILCMRKIKCCEWEEKQKKRNNNDSSEI